MGATLDARLIRAIPKAEVHVHLEGAIELADLLELARESGTPLPGPARTLFDTDTHHASAAGSPTSSPLSSYLRFLDWEGSLYRTPAQLARLAYRFAVRQATSGIRYTDVIVNPGHWSPWRQDVPGLMDALRQGLDEAAADGLGDFGLCVSLSRSQSSREAEELAELLVAVRPERVVALSIDGDERRSGRTGEVFAAAFRIARDGGLRRTVHAGESSGPEGVWDAIELLHADRIDHGIRAIEDERLVDTLAERGIALGVCPSSNVVLGLYPELEQHPLPLLVKRGVRVTVNTDDPAAIGTSVEAEWAACARAFDWDLAQLRSLARASFEASFASEEVRRAGLNEVDAHFATAFGLPASTEETTAATASVKVPAA